MSDVITGIKAHGDASKRTSRGNSDASPKHRKCKVEWEIVTSCIVVRRCTCQLFAALLGGNFTRTGFDLQPLVEFFGDQVHQPHHILHRDLIRPEPKHAPSCETRFKIFLQVRVEASGAVMASVHPDATLHLDQATRFQMRKIRPPTSLEIKAILPLQ